MDVDIPIDPDLLLGDPQHAIDPDLEYAEGALDVLPPLDDDPSQHHLHLAPSMHDQQLDYYAQADANGQSGAYHLDSYSASPSRLRASSSQSRVDSLPADYSPFDDLLSVSVASPSEAHTSHRSRHRAQKTQHLMPPGSLASPRRSPSKPSRPKMNGRARANGNGSATPRAGSSAARGRTVTRDDYCSFCAGTDERNKNGQPERMTSCHRYRIMSYDWHCIECKTCEICNVKGDDNRLLFCDGCDRGWHSYCLVPPLAKPPKGNWHCASCAPNSRGRNPSPLSSMPAPSKGKGKGKGRGSEPAPSPQVSTPIQQGPSRPRKSIQLGHDDPFHGSKIKSSNRPGRKRKEYRSETEDVSTPPVRIKLRISSGNHKHVEVESEEEKEPYGGILAAKDADQSKTSITERDKDQFERARIKAEVKLGGPPVISQPQPMPSSPAGSGASDYFPSPLRSQALAVRPLRERLLSNTLPTASPAAEHSPAHTPRNATTSEKIKTIRFGPYDIDTWFSAPYPEEYQHVPDGRLWLCEFCLKYMKSGFSAGRHRVKCKARHPPGDEIYRKDNVSVFEVDGRKNKIYCQNLCLLAKMFLDTKTLYYDVEPFLFYVMTEVDELGARFVGYFSKEKRSPDNNVSCIMTLPVRQRKGWGQLLIDFSYQLSKKEGRVGSPERPLSGLGAVTYRKYWTMALFRYLRNAPDTPTIDDISASTSMTPEDIYATLVNESMIEDLDTPPPDEFAPNFSAAKKKYRGRARPSTIQPRKGDAPESDKPIVPERYVIRWDRDYVEAVLRKNESRGYLTLAPERLKYHPFLVTRNPAKPPGAIAQATLKANHGGAIKSGDGLGDRDDTTREGTAEDDTVKVVQGEDKATLDLVAALSNSPKRSLRQRKSGEIVMDRASRVVSGTPEQRRKSTRGISIVKDPDEESDDPLMLGNGHGETPKRGPKKKGTILSDMDEDMDADAEGEEDEDGEWEADVDLDAEGEDDEEYVE